MSVAVFVVRVLVGAVLLVAGALKAGHPVDLAATIAAFRMVPGSIAGPLALAIPYLEIVLGYYLAVGVFTRSAGWIAATQFAVYASAIASAVLRHIPANCGCFGPTDSTPADWPHVGMDMALALASAFVAWGAPGALSLESWVVRRFPKHHVLAWVAYAVLAAIAAGSFGWYNFHPSKQLIAAAAAPVVPKASLGAAAPEFSAATTSGFFDLGNAGGKPVFLEIFATWCETCKRMTPIIDKLYETYGSRVTFVAVSGSDTAMDGTSDASQLDVLDWKQRNNVRYPVAYDPDLTVASLYLQGSFPTLAIIGKEKNVDYLAGGFVDYAALAKALEKAIR